MELVSQMIKEVIRYADVDREKFAGEIRAELEQRQTADFGAQKSGWHHAKSASGSLKY